MNSVYQITYANGVKETIDEDCDIQDVYCDCGDEDNGEVVNVEIIGYKINGISI